MGFWADEKDSNQELFDNLGDYVPRSISDDCKVELRRRGVSEEKIQREEFARTNRIYG